MLMRNELTEALEDVKEYTEDEERRRRRALGAAGGSMGSMSRAVQSLLLVVSGMGRTVLFVEQIFTHLFIRMHIQAGGAVLGVLGTRATTARRRPGGVAFHY